MKTLGRIAIILFAALVVAGATVAFTQSALASTLLGTAGRAGFEQRHFERQSASGELQAGQQSGNFEHRGHDEGMGGISMITLGPIIKDVAIMGSITALVVAATLLLRAVRRSNRTTKILAAGSGDSQQGLNSTASINGA